MIIILRYFCIIRLHEEILDFYDFMKPTKEEHEMRSHVIKSVQDVVVEMWPNVKVFLYILGVLHIFFLFYLVPIDQRADVLNVYFLKSAICNKPYQLPS